MFFFFLIVFRCSSIYRYRKCKGAKSHIQPGGPGLKFVPPVQEVPRSNPGWEDIFFCAEIIVLSKGFKIFKAFIL